ncbi:hypothetical protein BH11PSE5_BH11PSE5_05250 [soil metagenome]
MRRHASYIPSTMKGTIAIIATCAAGARASPALADPCEAVLPFKGCAFSGPAGSVGDSDGLRVSPAGRPTRWIEIRLAGFYARELHAPGGIDAKSRLERIVMGKTLTCRASRGDYDPVVARCTLLRAASGTQGRQGKPGGT